MKIVFLTHTSNGVAQTNFPGDEFRFRFNSRCRRLAVELDAQHRHLSARVRICCRFASLERVVRCRSDIMSPFVIRV